ncbi:MAG: malate dehydrogenase [Candidatus Omnitrophota bacterium]
MKISIIGAGNVGATLAGRILERDLADVILIDINAGLAKGKALDLMQSASILGFQSVCVGGDDYNLIKDSDLVVITAGLPRKPGMSRDDLLKKNMEIVKEVSLNIKKYSSETIILVVTNPLDIMVYAVLKTTGFKREKVIGMAGVLDSARFSFNIADALKVPIRTVESMVLGMHSDGMIPLVSNARISETDIEQLAAKEKIEEITGRTKNGGAEIVSLLGSGSAYFAPSAAAFFMAEAILKDTKKIVPASVYLKGEYGLDDVCIGVPVELCAKGMKRVVEIKLPKEEERALKESAGTLKEKLSQLSF